MAPVTVLVVDDDHLFCRMVQDILGTVGYTVVEAVDGADGLEKATTLHPDAILLDLLMPGIDGYEVCHGLKANPETLAIPVIFVTSSPDVTLDHLAYAAGAIACIRKPLRRDALLAVIAAALKSGAGHGLPGKN
jgi:CheY-like chemotaxis protein